MAGIRVGPGRRFQAAHGPRTSCTGQPTLYFPLVSDLPIHLESPLDASLAAALDVEGKILRALDALGPIAGRDVVLVGGGQAEHLRLGEAGGRLTPIEPYDPDAALPWSLPDGSADAVVAAWSAFRGVDAAELAEADRVLRPEGRLLVVHDYGRDDVSRLRGDLPEYSLWSRRDGPFLSTGFRIRVLHCFWTFEIDRGGPDVPRGGIRRSGSDVRRGAEAAAAVVQRCGLPPDPGRRGQLMRRRRSYPTA